MFFSLSETLCLLYFMLLSLSWEWGHFGRRLNQGRSRWLWAAGKTVTKQVVSTFVSSLWIQVPFLEVIFSFTRMCSSGNIQFTYYKCPIQWLWFVTLLTFKNILEYIWHQFSSVTQARPTLCNPMDCSMPGLPVHHQLPEFTQTHLHWVGDAIQLYMT